MKRPLNIRMHDDSESATKAWAKKLQKIIGTAHTVTPISDLHFHDCLQVLDRRRKDVRKGVKAKFVPCPEIDDADVLVVDYDLLTSKRSAFATGEQFAYLSRCYSTCGVVVVVNQFGGDLFDLTLKGHAESFADLNVGENQLFCKGLWAEPWGNGFRSWHWPLIPALVDDFTLRVSGLKGKLDRSIISHLEMDSYFAMLSGPSVEFLQGNLREPKIEAITFREFVEKNSIQGLRRSDKPLDDNAVARIAASRIGKWLERLVLTGQDILVDAPHLVSRFPSLLSGPPNRRESWDATAKLSERKVKGIRGERISGFRFKQEHWLSRPSWIWPQVSSSKDIPEVKNPFGSERPKRELVFCEDVSRFLPRGSAKEFVAELPSPFVRRFIAGSAILKPSKKVVQYAPAFRLAL
jgi:hypothetical protein